MKTTLLKRLISFSLALALVVSVFPSFGLTTYAAETWPPLSTSSYCEYVSPGKINVYRDSALSIRGASNKSYNAYIDAGDTLKIYEITSDYTYLGYPTSAGMKTGYVKTSTLFGVSIPSEKVTSGGKVTTYKSASTGEKSGSVAKGDAVFKLGKVKGGEFTLIMYTAASGARAYKIAFVKTEDYNNLIVVSHSSISPNVDSSSTSDVQRRLYDIASGKLKYDSETVLKIGKIFTGNRASEQCKGYAKNVFKLCFNITPGSTQGKPNNYLLNDTEGMSLVGSVTKMTAENIEGLFRNCKPGDFVQIRRTHGGSHSAILYSISNDGVTFLEANTDGYNTISLGTYSWQQLCDKNAAMGVYTSTDYILH